MNLSRLFSITLLVSALTVLGCGDSGSGSNGGGDGGSNGGGGPCDVGSCVSDATLRQACEAGVAACELTLEGAPLQTCINGAVADACTE